jgi:DNA-binding transcriptional ArsR family regulator
MERLTKGRGEARVKELQDSVERLRKSERTDLVRNWGSALHSKTRLTILSLLNLYGELTTTELQAILRLSQPNVSRHLTILEFVGTVKHRNKGRWTYYSVTGSMAQVLP